MKPGAPCCSGRRKGLNTIEHSRKYLYLWSLHPFCFCVCPGVFLPQGHALICMHPGHLWSSCLTLTLMLRFQPCFIHTCILYTHIHCQSRAHCPNRIQASFRSYSCTGVSRNALLPIFTTVTKRSLEIEQNKIK